MTKTELIEKLGKEIACLWIEKEIAMRELNEAGETEEFTVASYNFDLVRAKLDEAGHIADNLLKLDRKKLNQAIDRRINLMLRLHGTYLKAYEAGFRGMD